MSCIDIVYEIIIKRILLYIYIYTKSLIEKSDNRLIYFYIVLIHKKKKK